MQLMGARFSTWLRAWALSAAPSCGRHLARPWFSSRTQYLDHGPVWSTRWLALCTEASSQPHPSSTTHPPPNLFPARSTTMRSRRTPTPASAPSLTSTPTATAATCPPRFTCWRSARAASWQRPFGRRTARWAGHCRAGTAAVLWPGTATGSQGVPRAARRHCTVRGKLRGCQSRGRALLHVHHGWCGCQRAEGS